MMEYTRIYEVSTEADSEEQANANFEEDGPECGPTCSEAVEVERTRITDAISEAQEAMGVKADHTLVLDEPTRRGDATQHRHVAIAWEGGVLWLDMSDLGDHFCIDVRQFDAVGNIVPTGVFAIEDGRRVGFDDTGVKAVGHPAVGMPILLRDK